MLKVTIELDKHGLGTDLKKLGEIQIINNNKGTKESGNYDYLVFDERGRITRDSKNSIVGFDRLKNNVFQLLLLVLEDWQQFYD